MKVQIGGAGIVWPETEPGQCLSHGYVIERCCKGWEPMPKTTFLKDALADVKRFRISPFPITKEPR